MIIIAGSVDVDPDRREEALEAGKIHVEATRQLPGCRDYVWSADPTTPGRIYVFERWESRDALLVHFASADYTGMRDTIAARGIRGLDVSKYKIAACEPVYDRSGKPSADFESGA